MQTLKFFTLVALGASVAACGKMPDIASRNAPFEVTPPVQAVQSGSLPQAHNALPMTVTAINISVPQSLTVSEANSYYPKGDIVWRGDPIGDRHAQVAALLEAGFKEGTKDMNGATAVTLDVEVVRFHSVTEKSRYTVGGVHNIMFNLTVRRASTGQALTSTAGIEANLPALGGVAAVEADRQGQTQKVRVTAHLAQVIQRELARFVTS